MHTQLAQGEGACRPAAAQTAGIATARLLVIDDTPSIHEDIRAILQHDPQADDLEAAAAALFGDLPPPAPRMPRFEIDSACQGRDGLALVEQAVAEGRPYAAAFVDLRLTPGWDGLHTIEQIWRVAPELNVVVFTSYSNCQFEEMSRRLRHPERWLILRKPFDHIEVRQLAIGLAEKDVLARRANLRMDVMKALVAERTKELERLNERLKVEIQERIRAAELLKEREARLRQSDKLEAIGALAGGVAHEFNNLLQAIQGFARFAKAGLREDEPRCQDIDQIIKASSRAASLTSKLLRFSRIEQAEKTTVDLHALMEDLGQMLKATMGEWIEFELTVAPDTPAFAGDPDALETAILNLCVNARDAMPGGGRLTVRAESTCLTSKEGELYGAARPGAHLLITVADTGVGMTREQLGHIFEPFYTTKEVGKGTGLGLAVVHGIVAQHEGAIHVQSSPGQGTVVRIYLPLDREAAPQEARQRSLAAPRGGETILVAEDEPMVRQVAVRVLESAGYSVISAADGEEAVRQFVRHQHNVSLALLDVVMPKLKGREAFEQIRQVRPDVRAIFCTGYDPETAATQRLELERLTVVRKPYDPSELLCAVRQVLDGQGAGVV